jgi:hypothetical protein
VEDLGAPASYLTLDNEAAVLARDGHRIGRVEHVLADPDADIFDGIVLDTSVLPGGHRFVDASQVDEVYERGVMLTLDAEAAQRLPEPSENPATLDAGPEETVPDDLGDKLKRAWDLISGNY